MSAGRRKFESESLQSRNSFQVERGRKKDEESKAFQELQKENAGLLKELSEIKSLHDQLLHENPRENISIQRVNILKSQIFQLERQVIALSDVVNSYARTNLEVQEICQGMADRLKLGSSSNEDALKFVMQIQSRLSRPNRGAAADHALPLLFMGNFIKPGPSSKDSECLPRVVGKEEECVPSLLDVCSGKMDHVNMRQVSVLESKLAKLYGELAGLQSSLAAMPDAVPTLFRPVAEHHLGHVTLTREMLSECCHDLMCLSLLVPSVPWSKKRLVAVPLELRPAEVIKKLPSAAKGRKEVRDSVEGVCKYFAHVCEMQSIKSKAVDEELNFHKSVFQLQLDYVRSLINAMREGYKKFETSVQDCFRKPLADVLEKYETLSCTSNSVALKDLLESLQTHSPQLKSAVEELSHMDNNIGAQALTSFEENFFKDLLQLERKHCKRD